jgi:hypothetical protein
MARWVAGLGAVGRLCRYLWQERLWWMIPVVIVLLVIGGFVLISQSSAVAPYIYTLF